MELSCANGHFVSLGEALLCPSGKPVPFRECADCNFSKESDKEGSEEEGRCSGEGAVTSYERKLDESPKGSDSSAFPGAGSGGRYLRRPWLNTATDLTWPEGSGFRALLLCRSYIPRGADRAWRYPQTLWERLGTGGIRRRRVRQAMDRRLAVIGRPGIQSSAVQTFDSLKQTYGHQLARP